VQYRVSSISIKSQGGCQFTTCPTRGSDRHTHGSDTRTLAAFPVSNVDHTLDGEDHVAMAVGCMHCEWPKQHMRGSAHADIRIKIMTTRALSRTQSIANYLRRVPRAAHLLQRLTARRLRSNRPMRHASEKTEQHDSDQESWPRGTVCEVRHLGSSGGNECLAHCAAQRTSVVPPTRKFHRNFP